MKQELLIWTFLVMLISSVSFGQNTDTVISSRVKEKRRIYNYQNNQYFRKNLITEEYGDASKWFDAYQKTDSLFSLLAEGKFSLQDEFNDSDRELLRRLANSTVIATEYEGIYNDGTPINHMNFEAFIEATNGRQVFWPCGIYRFSKNSADINLQANINWIGEGESTVLENFDEFSPYGDYVRIRNLKFRNSNYVIRWDASEAIVSDTVELVELSDVKYQMVKGAFRHPSKGNVWPRKVVLRNIQYDTIASGGVAFNFSGGAGIFEVENIYINATEDSTWSGALILSGEQDGGEGVDTAIYLNNIVLNNLYSAEGYGRASSIYSIYCEAQNGTVIKGSNIKIAQTNLPLIYFRGNSTVIYDGIDIRCTKLRSDFQGPVIISKTRRHDQEPAMIIRNSIIKVPDVTAVYKENSGDVWLVDNYLENSGSGSKYTFNVNVGEDPNYPMSIHIEGNTIKNTSTSPAGCIGVTAQVSILNVSNNKLLSPKAEGGSEGLFFAGADLGYTMNMAKFSNNYFYGIRPAIGRRFLRNLLFDNNIFIGSGTFGMAAQNQVIVRGNTFNGFSPDSVHASGSRFDWQFTFDGARNVRIEANHYDLSNILRVSNIHFSNYHGQIDSLIITDNYGSINSVIGGASRLGRVDTIGYLEIRNNALNFGQNGFSHVLFIDRGVGQATVSGNTFSNNGMEVPFMFDGILTSHISRLSYFDNKGVLQAFNSDHISANLTKVQFSGLEDLSGNSYLTSNMVYTQAEMNQIIADTLAFFIPRPRLVIINSNRSLIKSDVDQWMQFTSKATVIVPRNFSDMAIGQSIQILCRTGGSGTIKADSGVAINGQVSGSITLNGEYSSAILLKTGPNNYELY